MRGKSINMHSNFAKKLEEERRKWFQHFQPVYFGEFTLFREYGQQKQFTASQTSILWHFITTYFTIKDKVLHYTLLLFGLCVLLMKTLISNGYLRSSISWWGVTGFRRWSQCVCVCVMSAAPGRLCSTSHTVHTPSQSLYHSPASENKQEPLKCNCKQKLCGQA